MRKRVPWSMRLRSLSIAYTPLLSAAGTYLRAIRQRLDTATSALHSYTVRVCRISSVFLATGPGANLKALRDQQRSPFLRA